MPRKLPLVRIEWDDSSSRRATWSQLEDLQGDADVHLRCTSVGWLLKQNERALVIAGHRSASGQYGGDMTIPRCAVTKIRRLKE